MWHRQSCFGSVLRDGLTFTYNREAGSSPLMALACVHVIHALISTLHSPLRNASA